MLHKIALSWHDPKIGSHLEFTGLTRHQSVSHLTQARKDPHAAIAIRNISGPDWRVNFNARQPVHASVADGRGCDVGLARNIGRHGFPIDRPEQKTPQHRRIQTDFFQKLCRADHLSNRKHIVLCFRDFTGPCCDCFGGCGHRSDPFRDPQRAVFGGTRQPTILGHHLDRNVRDCDLR